MSNSLGAQLKAVLLADGSAPALALLEHLNTANGDIDKDRAAVAQFMLDATNTAPELIRDVSTVLLGYTLTNFTHWIGSQTALPAPAGAPASAPATTVQAPAK